MRYKSGASTSDCQSTKNTFKKSERWLAPFKDSHVTFDTGYSRVYHQEATGGGDDRGQKAQPSIDLTDKSLEKGAIESHSQPYYLTHNTFILIPTPLHTLQVCGYY